MSNCPNQFIKAIYVFLKEKEDDDVKLHMKTNMTIPLIYDV